MMTPLFAPTLSPLNPLLLTLIYLWHWESIAGANLQGPLIVHRVTAEQNHGPSDCLTHKSRVTVQAEPRPTPSPLKPPADREQNVPLRP